MSLLVVARYRPFARFLASLTCTHNPPFNTVSSHMSYTPTEDRHATTPTTYFFIFYTATKLVSRHSVLFLPTPKQTNPKAPQSSISSSLDDSAPALGFFCSFLSLSSDTGAVGVGAGASAAPRRRLPVRMSEVSMPSRSFLSCHSASAFLICSMEGTTSKSAPF